VTLNSQESINAINFVYDMVVTNPVGPSNDVVKDGNIFQQGKTAFIFGGPNDNIELIDGEQLPFEVGYAVAPGGEVYKYAAGTAITKDAKNSQFAYEAMTKLSIET